jgi:hypothetical protein
MQFFEVHIRRLPVCYRLSDLWLTLCYFGHGHTVLPDR